MNVSLSPRLSLVRALDVGRPPSPGCMPAFSDMDPSPVSVEASALPVQGKTALMEATEDIFYGSVP